MIDDHKYSIGRIVVYRHGNPKRPESSYGRFGHERTVGRVMGVELVPEPEEHWEYSIRNVFSGETVAVREDDIHFATLRRRGRAGSIGDPQLLLGQDTSLDVHQKPVDITLAHYINTTIRDLITREESEERARREGRDLPLEAGDYIRVRGNLRKETEHYHNHYARIMEVLQPEVPAIESVCGKTYAVVRKYRIKLEDGTVGEIYDPEVKLYYTAHGRSTILNWRAALFLAESFGDEPPYSVELSFLEEHLFTRDELDAMTDEQLMHLLASLLYAKGRMGLRDYEKKGEHFEQMPREYLIDTILATSRFNMRRNRSMTQDEIRQKQREARRLRRLLRDG